MVAFRKRAWLQLTFEEALIIQVFGGKDGYERRLRPQTQYGKGKLHELFLATKDVGGTAKAKTDHIEMGVDRMSLDSWQVRALCASLQTPTFIHLTHGGSNHRL